MGGLLGGFSMEDPFVPVSSARAHAPPPPPPPPNRRPRSHVSMASPSKSLSVHHHEDLSPKKVEEILAQWNRLELLYPSNSEYDEWKKKMSDIIKREGLLGFIDGSVQAPPKNVGPNSGDTIQKKGSKNGCNSIHEEGENKKYVAWKGSDDLVQKWIRSTLSGSTLTLLSSYNTAKELWEEIARREQIIRVRQYLPLYRATIKGDWETADKIIQEDQHAVRVHITIESETALIVAVKIVGGKDFVEKLVKKMLPDELAICDDGGRTALHMAAGFGNFEVAKLLVERNNDLPNKETSLKETPLFYAAERGDREMVEWLMDVTAPQLLKGESGFRILYQLTHSQLYDIALKVLRVNPELASLIPLKNEDLKFHALNALAEKTSLFPSGNNFNFLQELIYSRSVWSKNLTCFCHWNGEWRLQTNGTFLYHGGMCREVLINNSSQLDEFRKKICTALEIDSPNKLFFYNTMRDKTKYEKLNDQNGVTRLFHLNGDNVDVFVEEEGRATDPQHDNDISTRGSNVFDNSSNTLTGNENDGSKNLTCFCHWNGKWRLQTNCTFLYHGGTRRKVLLNNSSQFGTRRKVLLNNSSQFGSRKVLLNNISSQLFDELCKMICTALEIDSGNKLFFYNTMGDKTKYVKLNDQNGVTSLFRLNGDNVDVFVEEERRATDPQHGNHISISSSSNQEIRSVSQENVNNILTGMELPTKKNEGMELKYIAENHRRGDIEAPTASNNCSVANGGWAYSVKKKLHAIFPKVIETLIFDKLLMINPTREIWELREKKLLHDQALDLLQFLCDEVKVKDSSIADRIFQPALEQATKLGIPEIVEAISVVYPYAVYLENDKKQTIFQQAIVFRQEKVFNLIHRLQESNSAKVLSTRDIFNNNALHLAGYVVDSPKLNVRAGAAHQMQRELQWFKAVGRLAPSTSREERNNEQKTPAEVFSDTHQELMKEGEQCMKDTANSCIIVASLITTVVFAAAIQVPGGNNDKGHPIFEQQTAFIIFGIANSLALFSSIVSVIMFLSIMITSPNAEEDFLFALFREMIIGLRSLFFSILFTMIAFGAILYLMFGENYGWILFPVVAFGCYPVYLFAVKQLPFLKDIWTSMNSMFFPQGNRVLNKVRYQNLRL